MAIGSKRSLPTAPAAAAVVSEDMIAPRKTPCSQSTPRARAARRSSGGRRRGTRRSARRPGPPTPPAIDGHCDAGVVKRAFGCAAGSSESGVQSLPCQSTTCVRRLAGHPLPPDVAVVGEGAVGEDRVALDRCHRVRVRLVARARSDAEETGLGIDGVEAAVLAELHPGDVVTDRLHRPAGQGRDQHRQVGLAARRGECAGDVLDLALGRGQLEDQHVLGQPALVARHHRGDPQREALLAQQRVAAVARAERPDLAALREVDDVLVLGVAGPRHVLLAVGQRRADASGRRGRNRPSSPSTSSAGAPMRVMIRMRSRRRASRSAARRCGR